MAGISYTSTFDGEALMEVLVKTILSGNTLRDGLITLHTDFKKKMEIPIAEMSLSVQDSACAFNDDGTGITITPRYLEPKGFMVNKELCFKNLKDTYFAWLQGRGEQGNYDSTDLMNTFVVEWIATKTNAFIDAAIWRGSAAVAIPNVTIAATSSVVRGLIPGLELDSTVEKISTPSVAVNAISKATSAVITLSAANNELTVGTDVTILAAAGGDFTDLNGNTYKIKAINAGKTEFTINVDTSAYSGAYTADTAQMFFINENNVIDVLTDVYVQLPEAVENDPDFTLIVNNHVLKAYKLAAAKVANGAGSFMIGDRMVDLLGFPIKKADYFPKNYILATKISNLHFGTDLSGEESDVQVKDMREVTLDNTYRYKSMWQFDVNHTLGSEILLVRPQ